MKVLIAPLRETDRTLKVVRELPGRLAYLRRLVPYEVASRAKQDIHSFLQSDPTQKTYMEAIQLRRFSVGRISGTALVLNEKSRGVEEVDPARTLVFVLRRRGGSPRARKVVAALQQHNPWTLATIPFLPTQREARVVSRVSSEREVKVVADARAADRVIWQRKLARAGFALNPKRLRPPTRSGRLLPDVAFEGLRVEFGYGGASAQPHWRPGIRSALRYLKGGFQRRSDTRRLLTDPGFRTWRKGPPRVPLASQPRLTRAAAFQAALFPRGIRP